jgi:branched-chain amino acid aminotransferase
MVQFILACICYVSQFGVKFSRTVATKLEARMQRNPNHEPRTTNHEQKLMTSIWLNGNIVPEQQACISVFDHGLLYGDGVFEGIRFYRGCAFMLPQHLDRLFQSAAALLLYIPYTLEDLTTAVYDTIAAHGEPNGYIRLVVTRGEGPLGVDPSSCTKPSVFIIADRLQIISEAARTAGIRAVIVSTRKVPNVSWDARIKSLNYLNNVLAKLEARQAGADEAILLNLAGNVAEGAVNNVFVVKNRRLLTPLTNDGALAGVTRATVLQLAQAADIAVVEKSLTPYDLYTADECFLSGTGVELVPVHSVDGRALVACPGPVFNLLKQEFEVFIQDYTLTHINKEAMR